MFISAGMVSIDTIRIDPEVYFGLEKVLVGTPYTSLKTSEGSANRCNAQVLYFELYA
jgi:hypothetical protein